jgi:hypothetical protein
MLLAMVLFLLTLFRIIWQFARRFQTLGLMSVYFKDRLVRLVLPVPLVQPVL